MALVAQRGTLQQNQPRYPTLTCLIGSLRPAPERADAEASQLFSDDLLQHVPVQREVRHQLLQLGIVIAQLAQLSQLASPIPEYFRVKPECSSR
jgi:hypothetical protein